MTMIQLCGVCLLCAIGALVLRQYRQGFEIPIVIACVLFLVSAFLFRLQADVLVRDFMNRAGYGGYAKSLFKSLGICISVEVASALCKDCGAESAGKVLQWVGKAEIILLSLPLVKELMEMAGQFLS